MACRRQGPNRRWRARPGKRSRAGSSRCWPSPARSPSRSPASGPTRSSGTASGARIRRSRRLVDAEPPAGGRQRPIPRAGGDRRGPGRPLGDPRRRGGGARRRGQAALSADPEPDGPELARRGPGSNEGAARRLRDLRPAPSRRPPRPRPALPAASGAARGPRPRRATLAHARAFGGTEGPTCSRPPAGRASRGSSPSAATAPTGPASAPASGSRHASGAVRSS